MGEYVGYICMAVLFIGLPTVFFLRKSRERGMKAFYKEHSLALARNEAAKIKEHLGITQDPYCCQVNLTLADGARIPVYWCEWVIKTENPGRTTASYNLDYFLAIFFAPKMVTEDFMRQTIELADKSKAGTWQKVKDQFTADTHFPLRAERLADETFLIVWQMLKRREIYEARLKWLTENVAANRHDVSL